MRHGSRRRRGSRWCWWSSLARCWEMRCRTRSTLGCRELLEHGLVELMAPVKRNFPIRNGMLLQPRRDGSDDLGGDEFVRAAVDEGQACAAQPTRDGVDGEVEIGRKLAAPQREAI